MRQPDHEGGDVLLLRRAAIIFPVMEIISRKDAMALGLKRYFTGEPCPRGHIETRLCSSMACAECCREASRNTTLKRQQKRTEALQLAKSADPRIITRQEAIDQGLQRYFTGIKCQRGHIDERWVRSKACVSCSREKGREEEFLARQRAWRRANPDKIRSYNQARRDKDPEAHRQMHKRKRERHAAKYAAYKAAYTEANLERIRKADAEYRRNNPEKVKAATKRWLSANPHKQEEYTKRFRERRHANPEHARMIARRHYAKDIEKSRMNGRKAASKRRALKSSSQGSFTALDIGNILGMQRNKCAICRNNLQKGFHIDHIQPLSRGGSNSRRNIQLLCPTCNLTKHAKDPIDHMRSLGRLL